MTEKAPPMPTASAPARPAFVRWEAHRPPAKPPAKLPFTVKSAGHYQSAAGFQSVGKPKDVVQLFWCAAGEGLIVINGRKRLLRSGLVAIYFPLMERQYATIGKNWDLYWWSMQGSLAPSLLAAFGLPAGIYDAGAPPAPLFRQLRNAMRNPAPYGESQAVALAFQLLVRIGAAQVHARREADGAIAGIVDHVNAHWNRPSLTIKSLADMAGVNRSSFSRRFHRALGIPPGEYIARLRLQNAMSLLAATRQPVAEIAAACGYLDRRYFARLLKKRLGSSPRELRKNAAGGC